MLWMIYRATVLAGTVAVDSWFYGRLVIVPWNFAKFNVLSGLSSHYGTHAWHWYLTQGIPATFATHLLPLVLAGVSQPARHKETLIVCAWSLLVYRSEFYTVLSIFTFLVYTVDFQHIWYWGPPNYLAIYGFMLKEACYSWKNHSDKILTDISTSTPTRILISAHSYSCLAHKEFRFLLPLVPLCLCMAGDYITLKVTEHHRRTRHSSTSRLVHFQHAVLTCHNI